MKGTLIRVTKNNPCPICGRGDWCRLHPSGAFCVCNRIPSDNAALGNGWVHRLGGSASRPSMPLPTRTADEAQRASVEILDRTYRRALSLLPFSAKHQDDLRGRGMTDAEICRGGYASLPLGGRAAVCRTLMGEGYRLIGIPGFHLKRDGTAEWWTLGGAPGLLIPVRDVRGGIVGAQLRRDDPGDRGKYVWLSSAGRLGGVGSCAPAHVARPLGPVRDARLWVTEGPLKANLAASRLGAVVVAVPGVASWRVGLDTAREVAERPGSLVVAYDADYQRNPHVRQYRQNLTDAASREGWRVSVAVWGGSLRGLDDALVNGARILVIDPFLRRRRRRRSGATVRAKR